MKKITLIAFLLISILSLHAQQFVRCETVEAERERQLSGMQEADADFENWLSVKIAQYKAQHRSGRSVVTIPIIFHIIHNGDAVGQNENIPQSRVTSQLAILNNDFRRIQGTPGYNTNPVGADTEIEFCLAVVDPNGNILAEPGISRRNMTQASWQRSTGAANDIQGVLKPQTIWNPEQYLNIWVVNFGGASASLLGYAQFPNSTLAGIGTNNGGATTDGVVIRFTTCGNSGTANAPYNAGRTLTHEIGHFLGLRHIWGDGNSCTASDFCDDTPKSTSSNYGCVNRNSCVDPAPDPKDMVENYMDYSDDACMNIYTNDQKTRMLTILSSAPRRASLGSSNKCFIPITFAFSGTVRDAATNLGIPNANVLVVGAGNYNLTTDANGNFSIPNMISGSYTIYAGKWSYKTNTIPTANYTVTGNVTLLLQKGYYDDFTFDFNWTATSNAPSGAWVRGVPVGTTYTSNNVTFTSNPGADVTPDFTDKCFVTGNGGGQAGTDDVDGGTVTLTTPIMDLTTYTDPILKYYRWFFNNGGTGTPDDSFEVAIKAGSQSIVIDKIGFSGSSSQWNLKSYRIKDYFPSLTNNMTVVFRTFDSSTGHLVEGGVDMFQVIDSVPPQPIPPIANAGVSSSSACTGTSVVYNDLSSNSPTSWAWSFPGGTPATSTLRNPTVTYNAAGNYNARLISSNQYGADTFDFSTPVEVKALEAQFSQDKVSVCVGDTVFFTQQSTCNPSSVNWQFQSGLPASSTSNTVAVVYSQPGLYDVTLIATNSFGSDTLTQNLAVQVLTPPALIYSTMPDTNNSSVGTASIDPPIGAGPFTYAWSNGGNTSIISNVASGVYTVTVTDGNGCKTTESVEVSNVVVNSITTFVEGVSIQISPVPTSSLLTIETNLKDLSVWVFDALGRTITTVDLNNLRVIDLSSQAKGMYVLEFRKVGEVVSRAKVMKQ
jgi:PKD repeat protein